jgi:hypothetical protein
LPFVVDVGEDGADESDDGRFVGEDPHDASPALDLFVEPLERFGGPDLDQWALGKPANPRGGTQGVDPIVDGTSRDPVDVGLHHHRVEA